MYRTTDNWDKKKHYVLNLFLADGDEGRERFTDFNLYADPEGIEPIPSIERYSKTIFLIVPKLPHGPTDGASEK